MINGTDTLARAVDLWSARAPQSLYVHIPFCGSRCFYCDFTTYVAPKSAIETYVDALCQEFTMLGTDAKEPLRTVFFGGGTPTLLSSNQLARVLTALHTHFTVLPDAEITFEANPGTVDDEKLATLRRFGVNRLSFGAQTFSERLLMAIGRLHDADAVRDSVRRAKRAGFERVSVDLMFGLPEQEMDDVDASLKELLALDVSHISAYWLKVEQGTPFAKWQAQGALPLPGEDAEADMYDRVRSFLGDNGFSHYEVSNFAKPGQEAKHNLVYWHNEPYHAAGVGAHGYAYGTRYANVKSLSEYAVKIARGQRPWADNADVTAAEAMEDTMMLGLRLREGVSKTKFYQRHGVHVEQVFGDSLKRLLAQGLVEERSGAIAITERAWPIANAVFEQFVGVLTD